MAHYTDQCNLTSEQHRVTRSKAFLLSLITGTLGVVLLLFALRAGSVVSASPKENTPGSSIHETLDSMAATSAASAVNVTKTVVPVYLDTGGAVSICFTISGPSPHGLDVVLAQDVSGV